MKPNSHSESGERGISPVIGVILLVALTVALVAAGAFIVFNLTDTGDHVSAAIDFDYSGHGVETTVVSNDNSEAFWVNGVPLETHAGASVSTFADQSGNVVVIGTTSDQDKDRQVIRTTTGEPTQFDTHGEINVSFIESLELEADDEVEWDAANAVLVDDDETGARTTDTFNGGFMIEPSSDTLLDEDEETAVIFARDDDDRLVGSALASTGGTVQEDDEDTELMFAEQEDLEEREAIAVDGQEVKFTFDPSEPVDWTLDEENGASIADDTPSGTASFTTTVELDDPTEHGDFVIESEADGETQDSLRVFVVPQEVESAEDTSNEEGTPEAGTTSAPAEEDYDEILEEMDGDGNEESPYQVTNTTELQAMAGDDESNYELANDVNAEGTEEWNENSPARGFDSVELSNGGSFDGNGYAIYNLHIDRPDEDHVGLFGSTRGEVRNVAIIDANVTGANDVGIVSGVADDTHNVYATGKVTGESRVGGFTGTLGNDNIRDVITDVDVQGDSQVGGVIGFADNPSGCCPSYDRLVALGSVAGDSDSGGVVGERDLQTGTGDALYFDADAAGTEDTDGGQALTEEEIRGNNAAIQMSNLDSSNWTMVEDDTPVLDFMDATEADVQLLDEPDYDAVFDEMSGDGSEEKPYEITTTDELQAITAAPENHYVLTNDIDFADTQYADGSTPGFKPIDRFEGSFDGQGHEISNLYIERPNEDSVGLFGDTHRSEELQNVALIDVDVQGDQWVGSFAGDLRDIDDVNNISVSGEVTGESRVGGFTGGSDTTWSFSDIDVHTEVTGDRDVGGFVGFDGPRSNSNTGNTLIENTTITGEVTGEQNVGAVYGDFEYVSDFNTDYVYYDGDKIDADGSYGTELETDEITGSDAESNMDEFDWDDTWTTIEDDYPELQLFD